MTKTQKKILLDKMLAILTDSGWILDSYGNYKQNGYRIKMNKTSMRHECKSGSRWFNLRSDYYKNVVISDANNIMIKGVAIN